MTSSEWLPAVSRRTLLKQLAAPALAAKVGLLTALSSSLSVLRVEAAVPAALPLIAAAANLIAGFMRGDGGMGAMMGAINQKLDIVIGQLAKVQLALADISETLAQLPDEIDELLQKQYVIEKLSVMRGAMTEYIEIQNALGTQPASTGGLGQLAGDDRKRLTNLYERFNAARRELMASPHGFRPDAAVFAPAAFIFDLGINLTLETTSSVLIELVRGYRDWCDKIADPNQPGSTRHHINEAIRRHSALQENLSSHSVGRALGFRPTIQELMDRLSTTIFRTIVIDADAVVESASPSPKFPLSNALTSTSGCHSTVQQSITGAFPLKIREQKANTVTSSATLSEAETVLAKDFSVRLLELRVSRNSADWKAGDPPGYIRHTPPPGCYVAYTLQSNLDEQRLANPAWDAQIDSEKTFLVLLDKINAERVRIAAYVSVLSAVGNGRLSANQWLRQLGGSA